MMTRLLKQLKRPSAVLIAANFGSLGLGLLSAALQARILGPEGRGELATAMVPGGIAAMLLCFGLPDYFARQAATGNSTRSLSSTAGLFALLVGAVVIVPYYFAAQFLAPVGSAAWILLVSYGVLTPILTYGYCVQALAIGAGWWKTVAIAKLVPQGASVLGLAALTIPGASPLTVGFLLITTSLLGLLVPLFRPNSWPTARADRLTLVKGVSFGLRGWPSGALALLNQRADLLLLTALASNEQLGYYAVATTLAAVLTAVANSIALPTRNRVAQGIRHVVPAATATTMALTLALAGCVTLLLPYLVALVLGVNFLPAMPIMVILLFAQVPMAGIVVMTQSLIGAGKPSLPFFGEIVALATTASGVLLLVPTYGTEYAAWANFAGNCVSFLTLLVLCYRHIDSKSAWRYILISPSQLSTTLKGSL